MRRILRINEILKELDSELNDFVEVRKDIRDYYREVRSKYKALDFPEP